MSVKMDMGVGVNTSARRLLREAGIIAREKEALINILTKACDEHKVLRELERLEKRMINKFLEDPSFIKTLGSIFPEILTKILKEHFIFTLALGNKDREKFTYLSFSQEDKDTLRYLLKEKYPFKISNEVKHRGERGIAVYDYKLINVKENKKGSFFLTFSCSHKDQKDIIMRVTEKKVAVKIV